jgi:hypothetical protein
MTVSARHIRARARDTAKRQIDPRPSAPQPLTGPHQSRHPVFQLQRAVGNRATVRLIHGAGPAADKSIGLLVQRWPWFGPPGTQAAPKTLYQSAEETWTSLLEFSNRATPALTRVGKNIRQYLDTYDTAYAAFTSRLEKAEQEEAKRQKWEHVMMAIMIGTGVGLAAGELYVAATIVRKIAYEAAAKTIEVGIEKNVGSSSPVDFKAPAELNNDKVARGYLDKLVSAWEAVAVVQAAALAFSPLRDKLRDAERSRVGGGKSSLEADPNLTQKLEQLGKGLATAETALSTFITTCDIPFLFRGQDTIEQDLWIAWMAQSTANAGETLRKDETIGSRTEKLKVLGRVMPEGEYFDAESLAKHAKEEKARVAQIGKVGVIVIPPRFDRQAGREYLGILHMRPDAYAAVGRKDPRSGGADSYQKVVVWDERAYFRPGEVVMVITTKATGLRVERHGGKTLSVSNDERQTALRMLGITEPEYRPEAGEALWSVVMYAVGEFKDVKPPLQMTKSEDGVLVSEANGTKLLLVAPRTSDAIAGAQERQKRLQVPKVIVVALAPGGPIEETRRDGIIVTANASAHFIAQEIRESRRTSGR